MAKIAFLVYGVEKRKGRKRKNWSFDWTGNIGAKMIIDVLSRSGIEVDFCSPETAHKYLIVLVSLTSVYDIYTLIKSVATLKTWQKRKFIVVAGGFGVQNIYPLREYVDYAVFGRAENLIVKFVRYLLGKIDSFDSESVMDLRKIRKVRIAQAKKLYPHKLNTQPRPYQEKEIGCPRKCYFCHYTWAREYLSEHQGSFYGAVKYSEGVKEVLFDRILEDTDRKTKLRTALDGMSERLRFAFNKKYSNELVKETIEKASLEWQSSCVWIDLYQIGSYPSETEKDRNEFRQILNSCSPKGKQVYIYVYVSPFRPSPLTPAKYLPANLNYNWREKALTNIVSKKNLEVCYMYSLESPYSHFLSLLIERATEESDKLIKAICFSKKLRKMKAGFKMKAIKRNFDISQYTKKYEVGERLPTWYLESYTKEEKIDKLAKSLEVNLIRKEL